MGEIKKPKEKNKFWFIFILYLAVYSILGVFSWGFTDQNFPYHGPQFLFYLVHYLRYFSLLLYTLITVSQFILYWYSLQQLQKGHIGKKQVIILLISASLFLFFAFPAFSNDIFNYIATAKVTFLYRENPYVVMPIEIPNEPMLAFLHAANKTALYGPSWIALTFLAHAPTFGSLFLSIFSFKLLALVFFASLTWLIWKLTKSIYAVAYFSLNPLVLIETIMMAHNDVVMMFFALLSFFLLQKKKWAFSVTMLVCSIGIKFATVFLLPVYLYVLIKSVRGEDIKWQRIWYISFMSMAIIFLLSPLREEMYPWYFIWPLTFGALLDTKLFVHMLLPLVSLGLSFRFAPFVFFRDWGGVTPSIKKIVTFVPVIFTLPFYAFRKNH